MSYLCSSCGTTSASWYGKCPECSNWNTLVAQQDAKKGKKSGSSSSTPAKITPMSSISSLTSSRMPVGIHEVDRVLGGGFMGGEVILLAGQPGVGKSTLLLSALSGKKTLYVSGEESGEQVRHRADRLGVDINSFAFTDTVAVEPLLNLLESDAKAYDVVVIDSIQTIYSESMKNTFGSTSQIKEAASALIDVAKKNNLVMIIVGHITKDGDIAGPKTLEHLVDCVLYLEGAKDSQYRLLRAQKNRFGSTDEVGVFEMGEKGLMEVKNPAVFINQAAISEPGRVIVAVPEGSRSLFFEVQCLVVPTTLSFPRRVVSGVDYNKVQLLLAVLQKNARLPLDKFDVYVNVVGGISIKSTAADLGVVTSIFSSIKNKPVSAKSVFTGEIGLLGEVRAVPGEDKLIKEASRFGFSKVYSSKNLTSVSAIASVLK
ncbi:MAG: DNA repair protein RadA [Microgenomates group bacterium]